MFLSCHKACKLNYSSSTYSLEQYYCFAAMLTLVVIRMVQRNSKTSSNTFCFLFLLHFSCFQYCRKKKNAFSLFPHCFQSYKIPGISHVKFKSDNDLRTLSQRNLRNTFHLIDNYFFFLEVITVFHFHLNFLNAYMIKIPESPQ